MKHRIPTASSTRGRRRAVALLATGGLLLAACAEDDPAPAAAPESEDTTSSTMAESSTEMSSEMMMGAFGPACEAVPADGAGSFAGMAEEPAATAASANPLLSTLVSAVGQAGLVDTLNGEGPFTIFAPTNDAFAAIPEDTLNMVLADQELLTSILTYHVVAGQSLDAEALGAEGMLDTVSGPSIELGSEGTTVNGVDVVCSDVSTANATVHIIDEVLLPPAVQEMLAAGGTGGAMGASLEPSGPACAAVPADGAGSFSGMAQAPAATAASSNPLLSTLVTAVTEAGLVDTLNGEGPFTIFAPVNDAFAAIPADQLQTLLADQAGLTEVLTYHVVAGEKLSSADLIEMGSIATVQGAELTFTEATGGGLMVDDAQALCMDVPTANATVHLIDAVLMPS